MAGMKVKGKTIVHTRGDTAILRLNLDVDGEPFALREGDTATFSVKKNLKDTDYLLRKTAEDGCFVFRQGDTQDLPFGNYWYDHTGQDAGREGSDRSGACSVSTHGRCDRKVMA